MGLSSIEQEFKYGFCSSKCGMLAKCNLSAVIFSANQNQRPTKELTSYISPGESMQELRAELDYYSLSMIVLCQMCRTRRRKKQSFFLTLPRVQTLGIR